MKAFGTGSRGRYTHGRDVCLGSQPILARLAKHQMVFQQAKLPLRKASARHILERVIGYVLHENDDSLFLGKQEFRVLPRRAYEHGPEPRSRRDDRARGARQHCNPMHLPMPRDAALSEPAGCVANLRALSLLLGRLRGLRRAGRRGLGAKIAHVRGLPIATMIRTNVLFEGYTRGLRSADRVFRVRD